MPELRVDVDVARTGLVRVGAQVAAPKREGEPGGDLAGVAGFGGVVNEDGQLATASRRHNLHAAFGKDVVDPDALREARLDQGALAVLLRCTAQLVILEEGVEAAE